MRFPRQKFAYFALFSAASAFYAPAPSFVGRTGISRAQTSPLFSTEGRFGEYDDKLWDNEAKKLIYDKWDPNAARSPMNFNPFETYGGNSPDASGYFPGEGFFKDPQRGDIVSFLFFFIFNW